MQTAQNLRFTYQDYLLLPEEKRYELIDGDLLMTPAPTSEHQSIAANLFTKLILFIRGKKLGKLFFAPLDVILSDEDVVQPDLVFISKDHEERIQERGVWGPPDLVIEILSPSTEHRDLIVKRKLYGRYGVREFWIVDPKNKTIEVMGWQGSEFKTLQTFPEETILKSSILKDLALPLSEVFE